jgi:hypothetical protein
MAGKKSNQGTQVIPAKGMAPRGSTKTSLVKGNDLRVRGGSKKK